VKSGFDGSDGNIEHLGYLLIGRILKIPEENNTRVFRVEAIERLLNPLLDFFVFEILCWIDGAVGDNRRAVQGEMAPLCGVQALAAGAGVVEPYAVKPGRKIRLAAKLMD
jgi:hypothetical protein